MRRNSFVYLLLILLPFLSLLPLLKNEFNLGLDGMSHVARLAAFYTSLSEGNIVPRWAGGNINYGFGHPLFLFNYLTPYYLGSLLHFLGLTYEYSTKAVFLITFLLSGLVMYVWLKSFLKDHAAFIGSLFYLFAPYRFTNIFDRSALGESMSFLFIPLFCYVSYKLATRAKIRHVWLVSLATAGLILTHFGITLITLPLLFFYLLYCTWNKWDKLALGILAVCLGFGLAAFLLFPALLEGKYTHHNYYLGLKPYRGYFISLPTLLSPFGKEETSGETIRLGPFHLIVIFLSLSLLFRKARHRTLGGILLFFFLISLIATTPLSNFWWERLPLVQIILFPYRFVTLAVFTSAVLAALCTDNQTSVVQRSLGTLLTTGLLLHSTLFWTPSHFWFTSGQGQSRSDDFYEKGYPLTTGDWLSAPIWGVQYMEQYPKAPVETIDGNAAVTNYQKKYELHTFTVSAVKTSRLLENTLYFPGWVVFVDNTLVPIEFQDINHRGLISFWVTQGIHRVRVEFRETKLRFTGDMISLLVFALLLFLPTLRKYHQTVISR